MAADSMIDRYVEAFRAQVRLRHDRADLVDEITDHLWCAVEDFETRGLDRRTAELRALAAMGDPRLVASLMTDTPSKGTIMTYVLSRRLWAFCAVAVLAWVAAAVSSVWGFTEVFGWTRGEYYLSSSLFALASLATTAVLLGANLRLVGRLDGSTAWITGLAATASLVCVTGLAWMVGLWVPLLAAAVAWTLTRVIRTGPGSRPAPSVLRTMLGFAGLLAVGGTAVSLVVEVASDWAVLGLVALLAVTLAGAMVELTVRPRTPSVQARTS